LQPVYFRILQLFAFQPFRFPFLDFHAVLAAAQCRRYGIDVYLWNPCDALGRPHVYSPFWLRIIPRFLDTSSTTAVGLGLGLLFIASLAAVCRPRTRGEVLLLGLAALSPMTVYALERANNDLFVYLLILAGCAIACSSRRWRLGAYALYLLAGLLKYYPLVLLALIARERRRDAVAVAATALAFILLFVVGDRAELAKALANIPLPSYFSDSFAAVNLPYGIAAALRNIPVPRAVGVTLLAGLTGLAAARARRTILLLAHAELDWTSFEADCLVAGALLLTGCFFAAQNIDYRGVYFVLVMPGLVVLRRTAPQTESRRFMTRMIAAVLLAAWGEVFRHAIYAADASIPIGGLRLRLDILFWMGRELLWWWLVANLAGIALSYLRHLPLVLEAGAAFPKLWSQIRQMPG
jgi:Glycosyltransferase family 87